MEDKCVVRCAEKFLPHGTWHSQKHSIEFLKYDSEDLATFKKTVAIYSPKGL